MAKANKSHNYKGHEITPVRWCDSLQAGYRWYIRSYNQTGMAYDEAHCRKAVTLAEAKAMIDEIVCEEGAMAQSTY